MVAYLHSFHRNKEEPWDGRERPVIEHVAGASPCPSLVEARLGVWPMALRSGMDMNSDSLTLLDYLREGSLDSCYSYEYTQRRTGSKDVLLALALLCVLTVCSDILPADIMEAVLRPTNCSVY